MKFSKKIFSGYGVIALAASALFAFLLLTACTGTARPVQRVTGKTYELVLLHTNDHHGTVLPLGGRGGLAERASFVNSVRAANQNVLLLDAGDINTGTALSNMFNAEVDILAYNLLAYDAVVFGNHEFTGTWEKLNRQMELAEFPFFSSNIKINERHGRRGGSFLGSNRYIVKNYEGFRVGIFGLTTLRTVAVAGPSHELVNSLTFLPEIDTAREMVALLRNRERVDVIIALVHMGDVREDDRHVTSLDLAAAVSGIDIIVDGHSHTRFEKPLRIGDTWIVSAGERGFYVGKGVLSIVDGRLVNFDWAPVEIVGFTPDAEMSALIAPFAARADASLREVIGEAADTFVFGNRLPRYQETALGNLFCDAFVWYFRTILNQEIDFVLLNSGNIRAELPGGPLTREHILTALPFPNNLYIVSLTGSDVIELFDFLAAVPQGSGAFPQFSAGVRYTLDVSGRVIRDLTIGGAPADPDRIYRIGVNSFILGGGDGFAVLTRAFNRFNSYLLLSDVVIEFISAQGGTIHPYTDGRLTLTGITAPQ